MDLIQVLFLHRANLYIWVYITILQHTKMTYDMIISAQTTSTPQNNTLQDNSEMSTSIVPNASPTSFGISYSTEVKDINLSTTNPTTLKATGFPFSLDAMRLEENKTSSNVVQNRTISTLETYISYQDYVYESTSKEPSSIQFFTMSDGKPPSELFVGMKATIAVVAEYPEGEYGNVSIKVKDYSTELFFDIMSMSCKHGLSIYSGKEYTINEKGTRGLDFSHFLMYGNKHEIMSVTESDKVEYRQEMCNFTVFLQNTIGLSDGQEISIVAELELEKSISNSTMTIEKLVTFYARTSILERNKTASCERHPLLPTTITVEKHFLTSVKFRCWIPFYNPRITVIISDESEWSYTCMNSFVIALSRFGSNFLPGPNAYFELRDCNQQFVNNEALKLEFPQSWVNRAYYYTEKTTDDDILEFVSSVSLLETATFGVNYTFRIQVLIDEILLWNTTFFLTPKEKLANVNKTLLYDIEVYRTDEDELIPFNETSVYLQIKFPALYSDSIRLKISTKALTEDKDPALIIKRFIYDKSSEGIVCNTITTDYQNGTSGIQNIAMVYLTFVNTEKDNPGSTLYRIILGVDLHVAHTSVGDDHLLVVETNERFFEERIPLNRPLIFEDKNDNISSQIDKVLDRNFESCVRIPVQGEKPPVFLMKLNTAWLKIHPAAYNVTIIGESISCRRHGKRLLQVAYPNGIRTSSLERGFNDHVVFCDQLSEISIDKRVECSFNCQCQSITECTEILIFMANIENISKWYLCELIADNVV